MLALDDDGFLLQPDSWNRSTAEQIARLESIPELSAEQWRVIEFVREYYFRFSAPPPTRRVCRALALTPFMARSLFAGCLQLWRIAGLPNPGDEARAHLN